jgi:hypothetical protein
VGCVELLLVRLQAIYPRRWIQDVSRSVPRNSEVLERMKSRYLDSRGIPFDEWMLQPPVLSTAPRWWPQIKRVSDDEVCALMHRRFLCCWHCAGAPVQAHHMAAGSRGRSDELTLICMLCRRCHGQEKEPILPLGRLLYLKWKFDKITLDWVRVALAMREMLPDLVTR